MVDKFHREISARCAKAFDFLAAHTCINRAICIGLDRFGYNGLGGGASGTINVHVIDEETRVQLFGRPMKRDIRETLLRLAGGGIALGLGGMLNLLKVIKAIRIALK